MPNTADLRSGEVDILARQAIYRFLALALTDPRQGVWPQLAALGDGQLLTEAANHLRRRRTSARVSQDSDLTIPALRPADVLQRLPPSTNALNAQYEATFGLLVSSRCPLYETEYVNSKYAFQRSNGLADLAGFYAAFGLQISATHRDRPDHVVLELEFMAVLLGLERRAVASDDSSSAERREVCRDAQVRFLGEHLAWWAPALAKLLVHEAVGDYYPAVGRLLAAFIQFERELHNIAKAPPPDEAIPLEQLESCNGCELNA